MSGSRSQAIGDEGEAIFQRWARQAGFSAEKPAPDRTGTDFVVSIPDPRTDVPEDKRCSLQALVQVKTTAGPTLRFRDSVANWKRRVDSALPCFVLRLQVDEARDPPVVRDAYLIEVGEVLGGRVLKAARQCSCSTKPLHAQHLSVTPREGQRLDADAASFVRAVREAVGDVQDYAVRKNAWVARVGFCDRSSRIKMSFDADEALRLLLGESPTMEANITESIETRFGIEATGPLPTGAGRVSIDGRIGGEGGASIRLLSDERTTILRGDLHTPLLMFRELPPGTPLWRFVGAGITLTKRSGQSLAVDFGTQAERPHRLAEWIETSKFLRHIVASRCEAELWVKDDQKACGLGKVAFVDGGVEIAPVAALLDCLWEVVEMSGLDPGTTISWSQLVNAEDPLKELVRPQEVVLDVSLDPPPLVDGCDVDFAYVASSCADLGSCAVGRCLVFGGTVDVTDNRAETEFKAHFRRASRWVVGGGSAVEKELEVLRVEQLDALRSEVTIVIAPKRKDGRAHSLKPYLRGGEFTP